MPPARKKTNSVQTETRMGSQDHFFCSYLPEQARCSPAPVRSSSLAAAQLHVLRVEVRVRCSSIADSFRTEPGS